MQLKAIPYVFMSDMCVLDGLCSGVIYVAEAFLELKPCKEYSYLVQELPEIITRLIRREHLMNIEFLDEQAADQKVVAAQAYIEEHLLSSRPHATADEN